MGRIADGSSLRRRGGHLDRPSRQFLPVGERRGDRRRALTRALVGLVSLGVIWRVARFAAGPPLWGDEAFLAVNVLLRDFAGLLRPLEYYQIAPVGFLWGELAMVRALGRSEWAGPIDPVRRGVGVARSVRGVRANDVGSAVGLAGGGDLRRVLLSGPSRDRGQALCDRPLVLAPDDRPGLVDLARSRIEPSLAGTDRGGGGRSLVLLSPGFRGGGGSGSSWRSGSGLGRLGEPSPCSWLSGWRVWRAGSALMNWWRESRRDRLRFTRAWRRGRGRSLRFRRRGR